MNVHEASESPAASRRRLVNRDWSFTYGDPDGALLPGASTSGWQAVGLPHSFGIPRYLGTEFYVGVGVYRRTLHLSEEEAGRGWIALEFGAVFQDAEVWVNGRRAGRHVGGYTAFVVDLTDHVHPGPNLVAVRVSNEWDPRVPPRAGEHQFNGGIYRDVALLLRDERRIAWYGTGITTAPADDGTATVHVETEVLGTGRVELVSEVVDPAGAVVASALEPVVLDGAAVVRSAVVVPDPQPWSPGTPALYLLRQQVRHDGVVVDQEDTAFGIRTIEFTADRGFFLNGEHLWINGANVHQDRAGWGDAVTHAGIARDVAMIKDAGMNFIRGSHYPHHTVFSDECDRQGLLLWSEGTYWGTGGQGPEGFWNASAYPVDPRDRAEFEERCLESLTEMIRQHRNHPSIVAWSTGNEVFFTDPSVAQETAALVTRLVERARELDPTRPAAVGGVQRGGHDVLGDLAGYNGDGAELFRDPGVPNLVTEYGSVVERRPGRFESRVQAGAEGRPRWRSGAVIWCAFHHASIMPRMGQLGIVDYFRVPLRAYYWHRQENTGIAAPPPPVPGEPTRLLLHADRGVIGTDGTDDVRLDVLLVDDQGRVVDVDRDVELRADGPGLLPEGPSVVLGPGNGGFLSGSGAIEMRAYRAGRVTVTARTRGLPEARVVVEAVGGPAWDGVPAARIAGPPSLRGLPSAPTGIKETMRELAARRPVFSSSDAPGRPGSLVTDRDDGRGWLPGGDDAGAWVRVDLEGGWVLEIIEVDFGAGAPVEYAVEITDGDCWQPVRTGRTDAPAVALLDPPRATPGVRVRFPGAPAEVRDLRAYGP